jgi:DNA end-binding protein Ku
MPRAIWSGSISFGLVNIPVKLYNAVSRKSVSFNQIDGKTGSRIKYKRVAADDGHEVSNDDLVKGYELPSGQFVLMEESELAALDPEALRSIDIEEFVDLAEIDPIFYDAAYYLSPDKATLKPYALLTRAMEASQKVGIARFVMRTKQYLAAIRPQDGHLLLSTLVYADEVNDPYEIGELKGVDGVDVNDRELAMAQQLIDSLAGEFQPEKFEDTYRLRVLDLIERKAAGEEEVVEVKAAPTADKVVDLMAALEASVAAAKEARKRHPAAHAGDEEDKPAARPAKAAAKKAPARRRKSA